MIKISIYLLLSFATNELLSEKKVLISGHDLTRLPELGHPALKGIMNAIWPTV